MDKKERIKKFDDNLLITLAAIGAISVFVAIIWGIYKITFFTPIFLLLSPFISLYLLIKGFDFYSPKDAVHIILGFTAISFFCVLSIYDNNGKHEAYIKKSIYGGYVEAKQGFVEGDGETIDHYETYYVHESKDGKKIKGKFIHYFLEYLPWVALIANFFLFTRASKKYAPDTGKT